jgi:hypothetical protein
MDENEFAMLCVEQGLAHLEMARELFKAAECPKTPAKVRLALSSAKGAKRAASHRKYRDERKAVKAKK